MPFTGLECLALQIINIGLIKILGLQVQGLGGQTAIQLFQPRLVPVTAVAALVTIKRYAKRINGDQAVGEKTPMMIGPAREPITCRATR